MKPNALIDRLAAQGRSLGAWLQAQDPQDLAWKPSEERWSMLEVVGHLCDEERDDFRARLGFLFDGVSPWPPIDPEGSVVRNGWQGRDSAAAIEEWIRERHASLAWLHGLKDPPWRASYDHHEVGAITATDLLASWVRHDLLHQAQLARLLAEAFRARSAPLSTLYAAP